jgi:hypothetical protein
MVHPVGELRLFVVVPANNTVEQLATSNPVEFEIIGVLELAAWPTVLLLLFF